MVMCCVLICKKSYKCTDWSQGHIKPSKAVSSADAPLLELRVNQSALNSKALLMAGCHFKHSLLRLLLDASIR